MGENHLTAVPTALYGIVLLMAAIAYHLPQRAIILTRGEVNLESTDRIGPKSLSGARTSQPGHRCTAWHNPLCADVS